MINKLIKVCLVGLLISTRVHAQELKLSDLVTKPALSEQLLDQAWDERENLQMQEALANYLLTKPELGQDYTLAWKTARLVYFIGNFGWGEKHFALNSTAAMDLFAYGVKAATIARQLKPKGIEGIYWYAVDLGSYGLAKGIVSSVFNVKSGMNALEEALVIDPNYQFYGATRILGRYYQEVPSIFGGSKKRAQELLISATIEAPEFSNNWVFLGQYYLNAGEANLALLACKRALTVPKQDGQYEELRYSSEAKACVLRSKAKLGV